MDLNLFDFGGLAFAGADAFAGIAFSTGVTSTGAFFTGFTITTASFTSSFVERSTSSIWPGFAFTFLCQEINPFLLIFRSKPFSGRL